MKQRGGKSIHKYAMNHHHEPVWDNLCKQLERGKKKDRHKQKNIRFFFFITNRVMLYKFTASKSEDLVSHSQVYSSMLLSFWYLAYRNIQKDLTA